MTTESRYLLDSDVIIEPMNRFYKVDICPGYWRLLATNHENGRVFSISKVRQELVRLGKGDDAEKWAKSRPRSFFKKPDSTVISAMKTVADWANELTGVSEEAKSAFLGGADPWLIAFAIAGGDTIVTMEKRAPLAKTKIKIPDACDYFGVRCIDCFSLIRELKEKLVRKRKT